MFHVEHFPAGCQPPVKSEEVAGLRICYDNIAVKRANNLRNNLQIVDFQGIVLQDHRLLLDIKDCGTLFLIAKFIINIG